MSEHSRWQLLFGRAELIIQKLFKYVFWFKRQRQFFAESFEALLFQNTKFWDPAELQKDVKN